MDDYYIFSGTYYILWTSYYTFSDAYYTFDETYDIRWILMETSKLQPTISLLQLVCIFH
ncbi:hypothetical protein [Neobacillus sp. 204]|uniref:hypothetical protein n=1 Tax=Neobacillus sp. 204 TaxID=3383351 RepID=UPI00397D00C5